ncbi:hypothetical protein ACAW74_27400 [Fibrella sp. WM1]|uniref:hypothetical protein n=1 Tax=Fibrella musci TaxID=3242485 RepID=UPI0035217BEC
MLRVLLFCFVLFISAACGRESDIAPTLATEVAGEYQTNGFLDYLCIALPADKMPTATLREESANSVTLTYLQQYPTTRLLTIKQVQLQRLPDNSVQLIQQGEILGTVRTDRAFGNNGLERQALVLRVQRQSDTDSFSFTGAK